MPPWMVVQLVPGESGRALPLKTENRSASSQPSNTTAESSRVYDAVIAAKVQRAAGEALHGAAKGNIHTLKRLKLQADTSLQALYVAV